MHLLADGMVAIPVESHLHPDLLAVLPQLSALAAELEASGQDMNVLGKNEHTHAVNFLLAGELGGGCFSFPLFSEAYCDKLLVEANKMAAEIGHTPNEEEERDYQIPELVLEHVCPQLFVALNSFKQRAIDVLAKCVYGQAGTITRSIQFARYEKVENGTSHGNWHSDADSDVTAVVSLSPDSFVGGGTQVRTGLIAAVVPPRPKGHILLFPGKQLLHRGLAVEAGVRDLLVFWTEFK